MQTRRIKGKKKIIFFSSQISESKIPALESNLHNKTVKQNSKTIHSTNTIQIHR